MRSQLKRTNLIVGPLVALFALLPSVALLASGCEASDNIDSYFVCQGYCDKKFDCDSQNPTSAETDDCIDACRQSIEDDCGNEHQAAANDQIDECVDKSCIDFRACMVFEAAPECYGFVN